MCNGVAGVPHSPPIIYNIYMLPRIKINYLNGQLGTIPKSEDGLFAIVDAQDGSEWPVEMHQDKVYIIRSLNDYTDLTDAANIPLSAVVRQFYQEASDGTELVLYRPNYADSNSILSELPDRVKNLQSQMGGRLRGVFVFGDLAKTEEDIEAITVAAQACADGCLNTLFAPIFVCVQLGYAEFIANTEKDCRNVIAISGADSDGTTIMGLFAGRLASIPVHRNVGRVKDGPLKHDGTLYLESEPIVPGSMVEAYHDARCVVPRQYVGLSGYYFTDDPMFVKETDDYAHLTARRTIDKAYRIAYQTLVQFMLDEIEVNEDGTMQNGVLKSWQQAVENAINRQMTAKGELSATDGEGCVCFIDPKQNVLATSRIELTLKVRPYGYARFIDVNLGFQVIA